MSVSLGLRGLLAAVVVSAVAVVVSLVGALGFGSAAWAVGSCANEAFRVGPSAGLPDCRAYEMVSPPDKNGGSIDGGLIVAELAAPEQATPDGEAVTYGSASSFIGAEAESALTVSQYISTRTADGWTTREITPTQQVPKGRLEIVGGAPDDSLFQGFNEDLSDGFLLAWNPQPDPLAPAGFFNPYLRDDGTGEYQLLSSVVPPDHTPSEPASLFFSGFTSVYAGMSADGQHVIFEANDALTEKAIPGQVNLYEWSAGQSLELVSVLPGGTVDTGGGTNPTASKALKFGGFTGGVGKLETRGIGNAIDGYPYNYSGALSSNGMRAFWTGGPIGSEQIYMHEITESGPRTIEVSASQKSGEPTGKDPALYWTASGEGSFVYFTSSERLTNDSTAGPVDQDLYQYDTDTGVLSDLSVDPNVGETANVRGVLGSGESEGAPYVYFAAGGVLAEGASAGKNNLYVSRGGAAPTFIATLGEVEAELSDFTEPVMGRTSRVSPDGKLLAFQSTEPLTGYDNTTANDQACPEPIREFQSGLYAQNDGRCMEVYEYNTQTGKLACASCNPSGLPPTTDSLVPEVAHQLENLTGWESPTVQQRYLLDDGRLFFESEDALLPEATNDRQNIYEYEPEGVGQCASSGAGSCLYLISTGESSENSYFADASSDGRDVFFLTGEQLIPQDGDQAVDMYDAREGGGFSSATPPPCSGEACKPAVMPAPAIYGAPSSATFQGAGNISAEPAVKLAAVKKKTKRTEKKKTRKKATKKDKARKSSPRSEQGRR
jgi:hypothetical protein